MTTISEHCGQLVVLRCWCGIQHAVPESLRNEQLRLHDLKKSMVVYCPLGHTHVPAGKSRLQEAEEKLTRERARHDQTRSHLRTTEAQRRAEKAAKTRLKNRIGAGVCPCCNRTFQNLARHMKGQHPDFSTKGTP